MGSCPAWIRIIGPVTKVPDPTVTVVTVPVTAALVTLASHMAEISTRPTPAISATVAFCPVRTVAVPAASIREPAVLMKSACAVAAKLPDTSMEFTDVLLLL